MDLNFRRVLVVSQFEESDEVMQYVLDSGLVFFGVTGLRDPPRPGVAESIEKARRAGVEVIMITGDQVNVLLLTLDDHE